MTKIFKYIIIFALAVLLIPTATLGQENQERIEFFDVTIDINRDATLNIEENIVFDFGQEQRHGIVRNIPTKYDFGSINIDNINVTNAEGEKVPFKSYTSNNGDRVVQIGSEKTFVSGVQNYIITYVVKGAVNRLEEENEIYWNVTGDQWPVPITQAEATVRLPQPLSDEFLQAECFIGPRDSEQHCRQKQFFASSNTSGYTFAQNNLQAGEGLTIALSFPKNYVVTENSSVGAQILKFLGIVFLVTIFWIIVRKGRQKRNKSKDEDRPRGIDNGHSGGGIGGGGGHSW